MWCSWELLSWHVQKLFSIKNLLVDLPPISYLLEQLNVRCNRQPMKRYRSGWTEFSVFKWLTTSWCCLMRITLDACVAVWRAIRNKLVSIRGVRSVNRAYDAVCDDSLYQDSRNRPDGCRHGILTWNAERKCLHHADTGSRSVKQRYWMVLSVSSALFAVQ